LRRILVLAPHPDDEVVGACAAIGRAKAADDRVFCLYLTTGVPAPEVLWRWQRKRHPGMVIRRTDEARLAAKLLDIGFIAVAPWATRTLKDHWESARTLIAETVKAEKIDALWAPAFEGAHQDHDVANALASTFREHLSVSEFAEYNLAGGRVHSQEFVATNGTETILQLTPNEQRMKRRALALYASEQRNLGHIGVEREAFRPLPRQNYSRPPHEGRLFWQRFQWVPFRHPRIDFEKPEAVRRAITDRAQASAEPASSDRHGRRSTPPPSGGAAR
jgi:LmbE family N-acetylglucosaminyl deacetylase